MSNHVRILVELETDRNVKNVMANVKHVLTQVEDEADWLVTSVVEMD